MTPTGELIAGIEGSSYVALQPASDIREALLANLGPGESIQPQDLPRVPTPAGGGRRWNWIDAGNNDVDADSIDGILVSYQKRGVLWGSEEPQSGVSPVLMSYDLVTAVRLNDDIGDLDEDVLEQARVGDRTYDWTKLAYNEFGSGRGGRGKRCKESRLMAILRSDEAWPLLITAGPGSLKTVVPFVKRLRVPHYRAEVSLTLQKVENGGGQAFSQIVPKLTGTISREEGEMIKRLYTDPLSRMATDLDGFGEG